MDVNPPSENFAIEHLNGVVKITISGKKNLKQSSLLGIWLFFWLLVLAWLFIIGYQVTIGAYHAGTFSFFSLCMIFPLVFGTLIWGIRGFFAANAFLWQIAGFEILEIDHNALRIRKSILGFGKTRTYEKDKINNIYLGTETKMHFEFLRIKSATFEIPILGAIIVSFSDSRKTEYLGLGLETVEAQKIVSILQKELFTDRA